MNKFTIDHPTGEQYQLDWYNDNAAPSNGELGDILSAHTGRAPLSAADAGSLPSSPADPDASAYPSGEQRSSPSANNPMLQTAVGTGNPSEDLQLASASHTNSGLTPYAQTILDRYDHAEVETNDKWLPQALRQFRPKLVAILQKYPDIRKAPAAVRATLYAITQLGDTAYGYDGTVTDPDFDPIKGRKWKCNIFASKTYARGADIGYNVDGKTNGYPTYNPGSSRASVPIANDIYSTRYNMRNFTHTSTPGMGDLFAFQGNHGEDGHSGLYLGGNLAIYAGADGVKLGTLPYIKHEDQYRVSPRFRTYTPGH